MARAQFAENLKEVLTCSVCRDYFRHPVTLGCGHSFCHLCLLNICGEADGPSPCPLCRKHFHVRDLEYNQHLGKLASIGNSLRPYLLQLEEEKVICERHQEEKNLFCEKDQSFLCLYCFQSQEHINHTVHTVQKAAEDSRGKLQKILHLLQKEMETVQNMLTEEIEKEKTWKEKVQAWRESMAAEYRRLHELLNKEEKLHSQAMVHQEKNNQKNVRESDTRLSQYFHSLKAVMADVEQHSWKNNTQLLQVVGGILTRYESLLGHPPETVTTLGILFLNTMMWEMLKHFKVDVTLDPQNVSPHFILSDDLRTVIPRGNQQNSHFSFSQHANNFTLGTQFFASGIYYWEVEVGDCRIMARAQFAENLKEVLTCSVCRDYFRHPVTLGCGHSFCHLCLLNIWGEADRPSPCPLWKLARPLERLPSKAYDMHPRLKPLWSTRGNCAKGSELKVVAIKLNWKRFQCKCVLI
ncbi:probable E3 ubiquitin-protein ligase TRIML1 [Dromiciops gliroides]|uniref:probable E3 ubiquitin-protein ligase TRIML1 n=1 Tax=Dromiciops gliroides TaxID=33562 RepID=UPI001CC603E4|nr:probable E3 ubiquitin-protein ligase TRIML1 [Dromiciops gliroides]